MKDLAKTNPDTIYITDNGAAYCGEHLGASARYTGRDISGQPIYAMTPADVREIGPVACECCGKTASALHMAAR